MNVTVLGSNAGAPSRSNPGSGYLVAGAEGTVLVDAGPGTFMRLAEMMEPAALDGVILSHLHVDHCSDLFALYAYLAYEVGATTRVPVLAPSGSVDRIAAFVGAGADHVLFRVFEFVEAEPGDEAFLAGYRVRVGAAVHPVPALVTRLDVADVSLVYSGDTGPGGDLIELANGATTLLCEAAIQGVRDDATYPYHLTAFEAGEIAAATGVFELVVTHLSARFDPLVSIDQASGAFVGPISYAAPGRRFAVPTKE